MEETKTLQEEYSPTDAKREKVRRVAVAMIDDFPEHPFKVKDDEEMEKLKDSISLYGVLTPVVARRCENGRYELISGHRRKYACKAPSGTGGIHLQISAGYPCPPNPASADCRRGNAPADTAPRPQFPDNCPL